MIVTLPEAFFMIVTFFYYHLNLIEDSVNWIDIILGNMILLIKNFHLEMMF